MKINRKQLQVILAGFFLAAGGVVYLLGFVKYSFAVGSVNIAIYPAAFLALVGVVQVWRAFFVSPKLT